ncbi:hypothetical protein AURDEDRAFT_186161 [Auricularia subglabra TFB-10046 SS5]|nr:hypothetical protein AURDEDRAFT_186161 [Auricularia subglabra TFB-10046 SS5]
MAFPPTALAHLGLEALVVCEDKALPIYNIERVGNKATCWIPSEAGKAFSVQIKLLNESLGTNIAARLYVDGSYVSGQVFGTIAPYSLRRKLFFSKLTMSDDDSAIKDSSLLSEIGTLNLKVTRVTVLGASAMAPLPATALEQNLTVHERAKKLGGHRTTLGDDTPVSRQNFLSVFDHDLYVEFEFRYRPQDVLQAMDIMPVPRAESAKRPLDTDLNDSANPPCTKKPKVAPACATQTVADNQPKSEPVDVDDVQTIRAQIQELEAKLRRREAGRAPIKREPEPIHAGRFFAKGEIIDLTDD